MELTGWRMSWWLVSTIVAAGIATIAASSASATTLLGSDFEISFDPGVQTSTEVLLATKTSSGNFLSAWDEQNASTVGEVPFGQIYDQSGNLIGSEISISNASGGTNDTRPRIGYSPVRDTFLVVWTDDRNPGTTGLDIYGQLILSNGTLIGGNFPISTATNAQQRPGIAYNSRKDQYLVVWGDARNSTAGTSDVYGQIISSTGTPVGSNFAISTAMNNQDRARVAFDPIKGQYLVVWSDQRNKTTTGYDIYGQRVGPAGTLIGAPLVVSNASADQFRPDITWDGNDNEFMVVFVDCHNVGSVLCTSGEKTEGDIYGQVIASGATLVGSNFPIATGSDSEYRPVISFAATSGLFQVIYSDEPNDIDTGASQIWGVEVTPNGSLVGPNMPVTPTTSTGIQERAGITWNPNNNEFIVAFVNQVSTGAPQHVWGQFLAP